MQQGPHRSEARRTRRVIGYDEVVVAARRQFLREGTVNMDELPTELAVSRSTLYRLVEGRDRLLGDVLWSLAAAILTDASRSVRTTGIAAIVEISLEFYRAILAAEPLRRFLQAEPQTATRVLFTRAGAVHDRAVQFQKQIFLAVDPDKQLGLPEDLDGLAHLYVRIIESLLYGDLLTDRVPDPKLVERAARAILSAG
jgi:hypothetical protein